MVLLKKNYTNCIENLIITIHKNYVGIHIFLNFSTSMTLVYKLKYSLLHLLLTNSFQFWKVDPEVGVNSKLKSITTGLNKFVFIDLCFKVRFISNLI